MGKKKEDTDKKAADIPNYTTTEAFVIASHSGTSAARRAAEALLHNRYIRSLNDPVGLSLHAEQQDPSNHDLLSNTLPDRNYTNPKAQKVAIILK